eukprot:g47265.t1
MRSIAVENYLQLHLIVHLMFCRCLATPLLIQVLIFPLCYARLAFVLGISNSHLSSHDHLHVLCGFVLFSGLLQHFLVHDIDFALFFSRQSVPWSFSLVLLLSHYS